MSPRGEQSLHSVPHSCRRWVQFMRVTWLCATAFCYCDWGFCEQISDAADALHYMKVQEDVELQRVIWQGTAINSSPCLHLVIRSRLWQAYTSTSVHIRTVHTRIHLWMYWIHIWSHTCTQPWRYACFHKQCHVWTHRWIHIWLDLWGHREFIREFHVYIHIQTTIWTCVAGIGPRGSWVLRVAKRRGTCWTRPMYRSRGAFCDAHNHDTTMIWQDEYSNMTLWW